MPISFSIQLSIQSEAEMLDPRIADTVSQIIALIPQIPTSAITAADVETLVTQLQSIATALQALVTPPTP
jgi:hypothetical protein